MHDIILTVQEPACPCRGCEQRHSGCHAKCVNYEEWRAAMDDKTEKVKKIRSEDCVVRSYVADRNERKRRNKW